MHNDTSGNYAQVLSSDNSGNIDFDTSNYISWQPNSLQSQYILGIFGDLMDGLTYSQTTDESLVITLESMTPSTPEAQIVYQNLIAPQLPIQLCNLTIPAGD
jgi:hypothetical protein